MSSTSVQTREQSKDSIAKAMLAAVPFDEETTHVMDYGCGTGAISQRLAPYCKRIVGIDINTKAVQQYNEKVSDQGIPPEEMVALCIDLSQSRKVLNNEFFDIIICSQAYHHFPSIEKTTELLLSFLKPGGHLLVADLLKSDHSHKFHTHKHHTELKDHEHETNLHSPVIHHGGLTQDQTVETLHNAGLTEIDFRVIHTIRKGDDEIDIFLAKGKKKIDDTC